MAALSVALGLQIIVLPWLVIDALALTSSWVGWVQTTVLIPNLLLLLVGGLTADKGAGMRFLVPLLLINASIHGALSIVLMNHWLTIGILFSYAILLGVSNAFVQPWKEYLLRQLGHEHLQSLIAKSSLCVCVGQAIGVALAGVMDIVGVGTLLLFQLLVVVVAAISFIFLLRYLNKQFIPSHQFQQHSSVDLLISGLKDIWQLPALRCLIAIVAFNGFFHIGVFIVSLPLIVRQVYGETIEFYSYLQLAFLAGVVVTTLIVIYKGFLLDSGKRIIFGLLYGGIILLSLSAKPTVIGLFSLLFLWGVVVGVSSTMGRTILQTLSPKESRGRMISVYQLALFGCAPLGALLAGYAIEWWGVLNVLKLSGIASLLAFAMTLLTRSLWDVQTLNTVSESSSASPQQPHDS